MDEVTAIVEQVAAKVRENRVPASRLVDDAFVAGINGDARKHFMRVGIIYLANNALHKIMRNGNGNGGRPETACEDDVRRGPPTVLSENGAGGRTEEAAGPERSDGPPPRQIGHPHPRDEHDVLRRVYVMTADGERTLPAFEALIDDLEAEFANAQAKAQGWVRRAHALSYAITQCKAEGVETISALPERKQRAVRAEFEKAWGA